MREGRIGTAEALRVGADWAMDVGKRVRFEGMGRSGGNAGFEVVGFKPLRGKRGQAALVGNIF